MSSPRVLLDPSDDSSPTGVPVEACTLPTADQPVRVAEFDALFAESLVTTEGVSSTHARFVLAGGAEVAARAQRLADDETGCCAFFTFDITPTESGTIRMDVTVPEARAGVLAGLVRRAQTADCNPERGCA